MSKFQSSLSGSLIFSKQSSELSRIVPGPEAVTVTGSLHITGSRLTLNGRDLELRISTLESSSIGDINIAGLLNWSGSINSFTSSVKNDLNSLNNLTSSLQDLTNISGSFINSGSISGSVLTLHTISGSYFDIQLPTGSQGGIATLPGGVVSSSAQIAELGYVTGSPIMSASYQDGTLTFNSYDPSQSFSVVIGTGSQGSGSIDTGSFVTTSSFNLITGSIDRLTSETGSYLSSGSVSGSNLLLHTVSGSTFVVPLPDSVNTGSFVTTSSLNSITSSFITTSSFNSLTSSVDRLTDKSGSFIISGSILSGSSLILHKDDGTTLGIDLPSGGSGSYNGITSSLNRLTSETGSYLRSGSISGSNLLLHTVSGSTFTIPLPDSVNTGSFVTTSSFYSVTSSIDNLTSQTGSYVISGSISGSTLQLHTVSGSTFDISLPTQGTGSVDTITGSLNNLLSETGSYLRSGSISGSTLVLHTVSGSTFEITLPSGGSGSIDTGSFVTTSSFYSVTSSIDNLTNISGSLVNSGSISGSILKLHTVSGSTFEITLPQGGGSGSVDTGSFVTTSSFNSLTSSVDRLTQQTGSYLTSGSKTGTVLSLHQQDGNTFDIDLGSSDTTFNGNRVVSNQLLPSLYSASFNAGTTGSIQAFLEAIFFPNLPPDFSFVGTGLDTTTAITGSKIAEVTVTDGDSSTPFGFTLSGPDSNLFYTIPQNAFSSSWFVFVTGSVTDDISGSFTDGILNEQIFDLTGSAIDNFNGTTTKPVELEVAQPTDQGYVYLYQTDTSRGGTSYNLYMGITAEENGPPPSASLTTLYTTALTEIASGALGQSVIGPFYGGTTSAHLIGSLRSGSNLSDIVSQATYTTAVRAGHYILVASSGSALTGLPTSMRGSFGGITAGEYVQSLDFGSGFGNEGTIVHEISLQQPHLGYKDWFVIGNLLAGGGSSIKYRLTASSGSQPTS